MPNHLKPTTGALAMLKRGWKITAPDGNFNLWRDEDEIVVWHITGGRKCRYPLTAVGFEAMVEEINKPF